jgi:Ca-activated chloride channel family protein
MACALAVDPACRVHYRGVTGEAVPMKRPELLSVLFLISSLSAQGLWIRPDAPLPPSPGDPGVPGRNAVPAIRIVRTAIQARIVDGVATTTVHQTFHNDGDQDAEGTWFLPLPAGAAADHFTMTVGGKEVIGEVLDAGQARSVYEAIVRRRRDPGLLEYVGEGLLRARIYPIPSRGSVDVTVRVRQVLQPLGDVYEWRWPLQSAGKGDAAVGPIGLDLRIESRTALGSIVTPHPLAEIRRSGEHAATVTLEGAATEFQDLAVLYGLQAQEFGLHLLPYRQSGEDGWFTLLVSPPRTLVDQAPPRRCVQFVVDTSGSMAGEKIEQAKAAVRAFLHSLRPEDRFQVITFASGVESFFAAPQPATAANLDAAVSRVAALSAMGGTNISGALQQALEIAVPPADDGGVWLRQVVFVTDGQPTIGLTDPEQILALTRRVDTQATRLFALGVGDDIDVPLIDDLVQQHRGARDFVRNREKIERKVDALCQKIAQPALTDVEVCCDGLDTYAVQPVRTTDLFCGEMLQVTGRYRNSGPHTVRVRGRQNGVLREFAFPVEFPAIATRHAFVPTLWARQHVASLLAEIRRHGPQSELVDEVKRLATQYGIVTRYTSQLIVEESQRLAGADGRHSGPADVVPASGGPSGPATAGPGRPTLQDLGRVRTGAEAVEQSLATGGDDFYLGQTRSSASKTVRDQLRGGLVRHAGTRVFVQVGEDLVEQGLPADWATHAVVVATFSDAYFELLRTRPQLREVLALGERLVFRDGARIVHVRPPARR